MIRELEAREIEKIYREEMTGDFPAEELKPIDLILRLKAEEIGRASCRERV